MDIKRLMICVGLLFAVHRVMCENVTNEGFSSSEEEARTLISDGRLFVFSDPLYRDVVDVLLYMMH